MSMLCRKKIIPLILVVIMISVVIWLQHRSKYLLYTVRVNAPLYTVSFSPGDHTIVTGDIEKISVWRVTDDDQMELLRTIIGGSKNIVFANKDEIVSLNKEGFVQLWNIQSGMLVRTLIEPHNNGILELDEYPTSIAVHSISNIASIGTSKGRVLLISISKNALIGIIPSEPFDLWPDSITGMSFSSDGHFLAVDSTDTANPKLWRLSDLSLIAELDPPGKHNTKVFFDPEDTHVVAIATDQVINIPYIVCSLNGELLSTPDVWQSGVALPFIENHLIEITGLAISRDTNLFAIGGGIVRTADNVGRNDPRIFVWKSTSNATVATLIGHKDSVTGLAFSGDGKRLVSVSVDETLRLWDLTK